MVVKFSLFYLEINLFLFHMENNYLVYVKDYSCVNYIKVSKSTQGTSSAIYGLHMSSGTCRLSPWSREETHKHFLKLQLRPLLYFITFLYRVIEKDGRDLKPL